MIFPTLQFAIFFGLVLPLSWALMPRPRLWKPFMIAASYVFYGSADAHFVLLLAGCTAWNQVLAILIARAGHRERVRSWLLALAIAGGPRVRPHLRRRARESAGRRPPRDPAGRPGLWRPAAALAARCARGHLRLRRADLLRLLGLLGHGHRARAPPGLPVPDQLQPP